MRLRKARRVREKSVRIQDVVAQEFKQFAVVLICSRSRHDVDNRASAVAELRTEVCLLNLEFLNRFDRRHVQSLLDTGIIVAVHYANAIQKQISLGIAASIGDKIRDEAGRTHSVAEGGARCLRNARSKKSQIERVSAHQWQVVDQL